MNYINKVYLSGEVVESSVVTLGSGGNKFCRLSLNTYQRKSSPGLNVECNSIYIVFDLNIFEHEWLLNLKEGSKISVEGSMELFFCSYSGSLITVVVAEKWTKDKNTLGNSYGSIAREIMESYSNTNTANGFLEDLVDKLSDLKSEDK